MSLEKVVEVAKSQVGITEYPPDSNHVLYNAEYYGQDVSGDDYPWCVTFLWWIFKTANEQKAFFGGAKTASCTILMQWYVEQTQTVPVSEIQPGDILILNFKGTKSPQHCGYVIETNGSYYTTIEGNTTNGSGSQDNGGMVCEKRRYPYQVVKVCRPKYSKDEPKSDYETHWAKNTINNLLEKKIISGYPDGTIRPNNPITRAEAFTLVEKAINYILDSR